MGGLAKYFEVDANLLRLSAILLCCLTAFFPLAATYLVAWILIPEAPGESQASGTVSLASAGDDNGA